MFQLQEATVEAFINDESIMLPRFQRKQTWDQKKNFLLAISLYRDYPLGVVVINMEENEITGKFQKWLLDGRQRRNALIQMQNPEMIYKWARTYIKFEPNATQDDLIKDFWAKIDEYIGDDVDEDNTSSSDTSSFNPSELTNINDIEEDEININEDSDTDDLDIDENFITAENLTQIRETNDSTITFKRGDLNRLLDIILMVHPIIRKQSGLTRPFNFSKFVNGLEFITTTNGVDIVNPDDLLIWLDYKKDISQRRKQPFPPTQEQFYEWIVQGCQKLKSDMSIKKEISRRWDSIIIVFKVLEELKIQIKEGKIGYMQLKNCTDNDAKKVFEITNSRGTPLKAAEILSAKPSWNVEVLNANQKIQDDVVNLYERMNIPRPENIVKWDVAATVLNRLDIEFII